MSQCVNIKIIIKMIVIEKTIESWKHTLDMKLLAINKLYIVIRTPFLINIYENNLI
jgi:hypothetical protein